MKVQNNSADSKSALKFLTRPEIQGGKYSRVGVTFVLILADLIAFTVAGVLAYLGRGVLRLGWDPVLFPQAFLLAIPCIIIYQLRGLYPTLGLGSVEELKKLTNTTTTVLLGITGITFFFRNAADFSRMTIAMTWLFSLALVPITRSLVRAAGSQFPFWRKQVVIIGSGAQTASMIQFLKSNRVFGLDPVMVLDGFGEPHETDISLPVYPARAAFNNDNFAAVIDVDTAILVSADVPRQITDMIVHRQVGGFRNLILIPNLGDIKTIGVSTVEIGGVLGLKTMYDLNSQSQGDVKRIIDLALCFALLVIALPVMLLIAILILLETRGGIFYGHWRIGKDGKTFKMWKFRTMVENADQILRQHLENDPELKSEWVETQKLKSDPRTTRVGRILRKFSLDELPQILNVLRGEMSLVGPRPIVHTEIEKYAATFEFYKRVKPGITGLWQVSGRNDMDYLTRIQLDSYYVRNWSVWLDIIIFARTPWAVIRRDGAY